MYFSATIFSMLGFRSPILTSLSVAGTNFIFTLVVFHLIDRLGRRRILLASIPVMIAGLVLCSVAFRNIHLQTDSMVEIPEESTIQPWAVVILVAMVTYVAGYAVGLGCVPWQQSEYVTAPSAIMMASRIIQKLIITQVIPSLCPLGRIGTSDSYELGIQYSDRIYFPAIDATIDPTRNICPLRSYLCCGMGGYLGLVPRDSRPGTRRGERSLKRWMGCQGKHSWLQAAEASCGRE